MDTIAGIATPPGEGGIAIVRISGEDAIEIASRIFIPKNKNRAVKNAKGYTAIFGTAVDGDTELDEAVALIFRGPRSYTGEDEVEIQCHGGNMAPKAILRAAYRNGARPADRGEYTKRAFLNGRISLTEAEAVAEMISAQSSQGERAALSLMKGSLFRKAEKMKAGLITAEANISAAIEFPDEAPDIDEDEIISILSETRDGLEKLLRNYSTGLAVMRGVPVVIAGSPNVGKSTIMNLLSGTDRAIVSPTAGTTRDVIESTIDCDGITLFLSDTAGIRDTDDAAEAEGVRRALDKVSDTALLIAVFDQSKKLDDGDRKLLEIAGDIPSVAIINKSDLENRIETEEIKKRFAEVITISAIDENSREEIVKAVHNAIGVNGLSPDAGLLVSERQRSCVERGLGAVREAIEAIEYGITYDAVHVLIGEAIESLAELSGENVTEEVLDDVFSRFCVGK
ncbi:MAG: tRNA uridine-5-carboxymethylaminomethyl(34) synthesis GTPase MnmE [Oscillospiraceae bacterium]|nr:tRNA uridine-5-carboxymethylaminomethyl(34) synthesis GTPase MnmE [Oscillospiraceae bacterium]